MMTALTLLSSRGRFWTQAPGSAIAIQDRTRDRRSQCARREGLLRIDSEPPPPPPPCAHVRGAAQKPFPDETGKKPVVFFSGALRLRFGVLVGRRAACLSSDLPPSVPPADSTNRGGFGPPGGHPCWTPCLPLAFMAAGGAMTLVHGSAA